MYTDKLSMAHSLEMRGPYLDRELVEYVERLPQRFKVRHGTQKWIHRQVAAMFIPPAILKRRKRGFAVNVVDSWFRNAVEGDMEQRLLDARSPVFDYLDPPAVGHLVEAHRTGRADCHKVLFSIIVLNCWLAELGRPRTSVAA
jgi:asparagine synthase (glutamine-hydrolysing)